MKKMVGKLSFKYSLTLELQKMLEIGLHHFDVGFIRRTINIGITDDDIGVEIRKNPNTLNELSELYILINDV
jgi:hypothetical protein